MHALVTGAAGFLGRYIVEQLLARGEQVRAMCRRPDAELTAKGAEVFLCDIRNAEAVAQAAAGVEVVFHAAGVAGIWGPWEHFYAVNTLGTRNVIEACRKASVQRLVYTSSPSVTFNGQAQCAVDESEPYPERWLCHYQHTKAMAEQEVLAATGDRLATCALRPHLIWGPRDTQLIPRLLERARQGKLRRVGDGSNLIDTVYVENAAAAHVQAADALWPGSPVAGKTYFITQGEPVACWEWIDRLLELHELPPVRKSISTGTAWRVGAVLETIWNTLGLRSDPPMTRFLAAQLGRPHYFRIERAWHDFGYHPLISTEEGLRRLIAYRDKTLEI